VGGSDVLGKKPVQPPLGVPSTLGCHFKPKGRKWIAYSFASVERAQWAGLRDVLPLSNRGRGINVLAMPKPECASSVVMTKGKKGDQ